MVKSIRTFFLSLTILAFLLFSTVGTTTVLADDGTGTDPAATETAPPPEEEQPAEPPVEETPPVGEEQPAEPVVEETLVTILEQVPENTTLTVLNSEGEALPLASQESAAAIASDYDPIWCPAGQVPTPGANGCTPSFASFSELLAYLQANEASYAQAGTIYIQQGNYLGGETSINFNNYDFNTFDQYDLTLQGGWDTSYDPASGDPTFTTTDFNVPIIIGSSGNPWAGSLTLNNINISGVSSQTGLTLYSSGNINLDQVNVTDSQSGAYLEAGGDVVVKNSKFDNNGSGNIANPVGKGLTLTSGGTVTLASVSANKNQIFGADVSAAGKVTITNSFFNSNQGVTYYYIWKYDGYGLKVVTNGDISLNAVSADDNYLFGAYLQGAKVDVLNSSFSENSSDGREDSVAYGLQVVGTDDVTLSSVTANNNQRWGADITTDGDVKVKNSFFNGNVSYTYSPDGVKNYFGYGLRIKAGDDAELENIQAMNNHLYGAHIEAQDVAIDTANFSNNGSGWGLALTGYGLQIISENNAALIRVTANNNQLYGADISASGAVAIAQSYFNGHVSYVYFYGTDKVESRYGGYGLKVNTQGPISLDGVTADNNYLYGANLKGGRTTVEDSSFNANGTGIITDPTGYGLMIDSSDTVTLIGVDASNNQFFGADIKAELKVTITDSFFSGHQSVIITNWVDLDFRGYGLTVVTQKDIDLTNVEGNFNNLWGAHLTGRNISVYDSRFNNNVTDSSDFIDDTGLFIFASGYVDITRTEARENRLHGAKIVAEGPVFIIDSNFTDNRGFTCFLVWCPADGIEYHGVGLDVTTPDLIYMRGTDVSNNNLFGALLNGSQVEIEDSTFNNNGMGSGLIINASDNVTLTSVTALKNGGNGVEVDGVCEKIVQVTGGTFSDNLFYGLKVLDATLNFDGTQIFANNGSGNVFTDTSTCVVVIPTSTIVLTSSSESVVFSPVATNPVESAPVTPLSTINSDGDQPASQTIITDTADNQTSPESLTTKNTDTRKMVKFNKFIKKADRKGLHRGFWSMKSCHTMQ